MGTMNEEQLARSLRVRMTVRQIPGASAQRANLEVWLQAAEAAMTDPATGETTLQFTVPPDLSGACLTLTMPRQAGAWVAAELEGVAPSERERFDAFGRELPERRIGHWIDVAGSAFDRGWILAGPIALERIVPLLPESPRSKALFAMCRARELVNVVRVSRSIGEGNPFTELRLALPTDRAAALRLASDVYTTLGIQRPIGFDVLFADTMPKYLGVRLTEGGLSRLAVLAVPDNTRAVVAFCIAAQVHDPMGLAELEGILGADHPDLIEYYTRAGTPGALDLHYTSR